MPHGVASALKPVVRKPVLPDVPSLVDENDELTSLGCRVVEVLFDELIEKYDDYDTCVAWANDMIRRRDSHALDVARSLLDPSYSYTVSVSPNPIVRAISAETRRYVAQQQQPLPIRLPRPRLRARRSGHRRARTSSSSRNGPRRSDDESDPVASTLEAVRVMRDAPRLIVHLPLEGPGTIELHAESCEDEFRLVSWLRGASVVGELPRLIAELLDRLDEGRVA